jgi:hypothetical protein
MAFSRAIFSSLVVVHNFDLVGIRFLPDKANPELVINTDTVLTLTIAFQGMQAVPRQRLQILQALGRIQHQELASSCPLNIDELGDVLVVKKSLRLRAFEGLYHHLKDVM